MKEIQTFLPIQSSHTVCTELKLVQDKLKLVSSWSMLLLFSCRLMSDSLRPLIDRVPEELQTEVRDIVLETGIKTIPKKRKCKKAKRLFEEVLQIAVKRREVKSKRKKERYTFLNAEFQRIARRDKAFLSDQCKAIQENNKMGKTRDLFKKIGDTKGIFHAKRGTIKD